MTCINYTQTSLFHKETKTAFNIYTKFIMLAYSINTDYKTVME